MSLVGVIKKCKFYDEFVANPFSLQFHNEFATSSYGSFYDFSPFVP